MSAQEDRGREVAGWTLGLIGVIIFGLTLPVTHIGLTSFNPFFLSLTRAVIAAAVGGLLLLVTRQPLPERGDLGPLALTALGVVFGFPLLSSWAMQHVPAAHGGVVLGLLPLATAVAAIFTNRERPSGAFWLSAAAGSALVIIFALRNSASLAVQFGDLALLAAVALAALGYGAGAELSKRLGGWQTISWVLLLSLPITLPASVMTSGGQPGEVTFDALAALLYLGLFSQFFGFFFWYRGLALAGVARIGQSQLLQPFVTILGAALLLGENITLETVVFALAVVACVWIGRRTKIAVKAPVPGKV